MARFDMCGAAESGDEAKWCLITGFLPWLMRIRARGIPTGATRNLGAVCVNATKAPEKLPI